MIFGCDLGVSVACELTLFWVTLNIATLRPQITFAGKSEDKNKSESSNKDKDKKEEKDSKEKDGIERSKTPGEGLHPRRRSS